MRVLVILTIILAVFIGVGVWTLVSLEKSADHFGDEIVQMMQLIEKNQWSTANQKIQSFKKKWYKDTFWWPMILDHQEIDNIEFALAKTEKYLQTKNIPLSLGQLSELKLMIKHIPGKEAVTIENIL